jgi:type I restriction enzyme S subunit
MTAARLTKSLGELFRVGSSRRVLQSQWQSKGVPFYRGREITQLAAEGYVNNTLFISEELYTDLAAKNGVPSAGDIMVTAIGTIGNSYIVQDSGRFYFKDASVLWLKKNSDVSSEFINWWLKSPLFFDQLDRGNGATVDTLTIQKLQAVAVDLPPLSEQHRIVTLLDEAFDGIATAKANAEKNLQNARAIFESHLQSVFAQRGEGWTRQTLGDTYDVRDGTHDSPKYHDKGFPLITSKNLKREGLSFDDVRLIDAADYRKINERSAVHKGDVLLAMIGTIGNPVVVEMDPEFAIKNVALLKVPVGQNSHFLRYYLSSQFVADKMQAEAKGTTQKFVGLGYLRSFPIMVPSGAEQAAVVRSLDKLSAETNRLEAIYQQKLTALDELKESLLHRAFTGHLT